MKLFFDTNVLLDMGLRREPHFTASQAVFSDAIADHLCFMSWHTVSNIVYLMERIEGKADTLDFIRHISVVCQIAPVSHADLAIAFHYNDGDFEDAMQIASALSCHADLIITRDRAGFKKSPIAVQSTVGP